MTRDAVLLLSLLMAGGSAAQDVPKGVIEGTVVDEVTGEPVRRASVELTGEADGRRLAPVVMETAGDGVFRFDGLVTGAYSLVAQKAGYLDLPTSGRLSQFSLSAGQQLYGLKLNLSPQGVISGSVFDEGGERLQGASVQLRWRKNGALQAGEWIRTNDRGEFRFPGLEAGEYTVASRYVDRIVSAKVYPATHFTGVIVRKGEETAGIDLQLRREAAFRVRVRVEGREVQDTSLWLIGRDFQDSAGTVTKGTEPGRFEVSSVPAGSWYLVASGYSKTDEWSTGTRLIEVTTGDLDDVVVQIGEGRPVTGAFAFEGPAASRPNWAGLRIRLLPGEGSRSTQMKSEVKESGAFTVFYQLPGQYTLEPFGPLPAGVYLASIKIGSDEYYGKNLDLSGVSPDPVTISYRYGSARVGGSVEGSVGDSAEERGDAVFTPVEEYPRRPPFSMSAPIQPDGTFSLVGVRPGEYLVSRSTGGAAARLRVEPNGSHTVQLKN